MLVLSLSLALAADTYDLAGPTLDAADAPEAEPLRNAETENGVPSAVGLGAFGFTACSGSLITPRIVLSAAHCGGDFSPETIVGIGQAYFGTTPADSQAVGFDDWVAHPGYVTLGTSFPQTLPQNDVGVVVLSEDAPVAPVEIRLDPMSEAEIGTQLLSVGWGSIDGNGNGSGTKRSGILSIDGFTEQFIESLSSTNPNEAQICSGDSGGPMYYQHADGRLEQWGVHSYGDQNCTVSSGSTRTDLTAAFILDEVERIHGSRDLCEINGRYGDGPCDVWCDADPDCLVDTGDEAGAGGCACDASGPVGGLAWTLALLPAWVIRRRR